MRPKYRVNSIRSATGQVYFIDDVVDVDGHMFLKVYPYHNPGVPCTLVKVKDIRFTAVISTRRQGYRISSGEYIVGSDRMPSYVELLENGTLRVDISRPSGIFRDIICWGDIMLSVRSETPKLYSLMEVVWKDMRKGWMLIRHIVEKELVGDLKDTLLWWYLRRWKLFNL